MIVSCPNCHQSFESHTSGSDRNCPRCGSSRDLTLSVSNIPAASGSDEGEFSINEGVSSEAGENTLSVSDVPAASGSDEGEFSITEGIASRPGESASVDLPSEGRQWIGSKFGEYEIIDELGQGGMGLVFLAYQRNADRKVALKVIRGNRLDDMSSPEGQELVARFRSEARAVAHLEHENIVTVYDIGLVGSHHYFSMQLVHGKSLSQLAKERTLTNREIAQIMVPVCRALQHAHSRGILHRDIKPVNIMVDQQNRPFITDFGLAKWFEDQDNSMTRSGQVVGTVAYMSPEQAVNSANATIACDVYSLGATIYHLLTGRPPFTKGSLVEVLRKVIDEVPSRPSSLNKQVNVDLETIALKCLEKKPESRYRTVDELGDDLQRYLDGKPILARPVGQSERFWRWCKRNPGIAGLSACAILLLVVTLVVSVIGYINVSISNQRTLTQLRQSLLFQAQAMQTSTEAGRREQALLALRQAAEIETGTDLRDEYVRYLDQADIESLYDIPIKGWGEKFPGYADAIGSERIIAVADGGKPMMISAETGKIINQLDEIGPFQRKPVGGSPFLARVSLQGKYLAGNSRDRDEIEIWDLAQSKKLGALKNEAGKPIKVESLVFGSQGDSIFCAGNQDGEQKVVSFFRYSVPELELLTSWQKEAYSVVCLKIVNGKYLVARIGHEGKTSLVVWNQQQLRELPQELNDLQTNNSFPERNLPRGIAIESNLGRLYSGESSGLVNVVDWPALQPNSQTFAGRHAKKVLAVDVSPNGRWLVTSGGEGQLKIWDKLSSNVVTQIDIESETASNVQWLPDGVTLLSDTKQGLQIWTFVPPVSKQYLIEDQSGAPQIGISGDILEFAPTQDTLFYVADGLLSRLDLTKPASRFELINQDLPYANEVFVSQNGDRYAVYNTYSANPLEIFPVGSTDGVSIEPSSDARLVNLTELADERLIITEFVNDQFLRVSQLKPEIELLRLDFGTTSRRRVTPRVEVAAEGGRIAISTPHDDLHDSLKVLDLNNGQLVFEKIVGKALFRMDSVGSRIVYRDGTELVVMDVDSGSELLKLTIKPTNRFAISGDGRFLAVMDETVGSIQLFNSQCELELNLFSKQVLPNWIALSPTGKWLAICDQNGAVRLWNLIQMRDELKRAGIIK